MPIHKDWDNVCNWSSWAYRYFFGFHVLYSRPCERDRILLLRDRAAQWLDSQWELL